MTEADGAMDPDAVAEAPLDRPPPRDDAAGRLVRRHRISTRLWHWTNVVALTIMLMSGLMIFNAHPHLYWGQYGANADYSWLQIGATGSEAAGNWRGILRIGSVNIPTTGLLGVSRDHHGMMQAIAFPSWATIPSYYSLADARRWHLAFAVVLILATLAYLLWSLVNGHIRRDLAPQRGELAPRHVWHDIRDHARLRFPTGLAALRYNILQKLAYGSVLFIMLPLVIATGLALSPGSDAALPWLTVVLGGRQSARSIHFLCAFGLVGFIVVHLVMVVLAGPFNEVRSMVTGWYRLPGKPARIAGAEA